MSRIYICDKCHAAFKIWSTTFVEIPEESFFGKKLKAELCGPCISLLRQCFKNFMEGV